MKFVWVLLTLCVAMGYSATINSPIPCPSNTPKDPCLIEMIRWVSQTTAIILTNDYKLWRTTDEGKSFKQIDKNVNDIEQHPADPNVLLFLYDSGTYSFNYTLDGGATLLNSSTPVGRRQVTKMIYHPTQVGKLMYVSCLQGDEHKCSLSTSSDWGKNWKTTFSNVISNAVTNPVIYGNNMANHDLIYILKQDGTFGYSTDYSKFNELVKNVKKIYKGRHYLYVIAPDKKGNIKLHSVSLAADTTKSSNYQLVSFPYTETDIFNVDDFVFLDDTTTAEYLAIHPSSYGNYGDIFTSDSKGTKFELSIKNVFKQNIGDYDFHRVRGLDGIYIANQVTNPGSRIPTFKTLITFDNGGEWRQLTPPATDINGNAWSCGTGPDCKLHLHGEGSAEELLGIPALRSHSNAIGVIIANGNVGKELATDVKYVKTFLSRDGGLTWQQIYDSACAFEFGDHGGIIVLAPKFVETTTIYYTFNQAAPFQVSNVAFPVALTVDGIVTEPQGSGLNFLVQGTFNQTYYLYTFGLADAGLRLCGDDDFEFWSPSDGESAVGCLMGQTTIYLRRKTGAVCYNNRTTDVATKHTPCACSYEDYECTPNYTPTERDENGKFTCNPPVKKEKDTKCTPGEKYYEDNGYQLVPDTACNPTLSGAVNLLGKQKICSSSHATAIVASVSVILIVGVVATLVVLYFKNERFHELVRGLIPKGGKKQTGAYRGLTNDNDDDDDDITV